jgi:hypothetical protein
MRGCGVFVGLGLVLLAAGCGAVRERRVVDIPPAYLEAREASLEELLDLVNRRYAALESLTVTRFEVEFTGGSIDEGYFERYRTAQGYLVARRPDSVFVNILNPLTNSSVLVMASETGAFQIWIPSRNQFVEGTTGRGVAEENPVYNVRPTHIVQGLLIDPITPSPDILYYREEAQDEAHRYYVIAVLHASPGSSILELHRKLWIERSSLQLWRQQYFSGGQLISEISYGPAVEVDRRLVPVSVRVDRPTERYSIDFTFRNDSIQVDRQVREDSFQLELPPGAELVVVEPEAER